MRSFFLLHIILRVGKQQNLENEFCLTVEDDKAKYVSYKVSYIGGP